MITANQLRAKWNGRDRWLSDGGARNMGRLVARLRREGVTFVYQYCGPEGAKKLFLLGSYDPEGVRGLSLPVARDRAAELTARYRTSVIDLHGPLVHRATLVTLNVGDFRDVPGLELLSW